MRRFAILAAAIAACFLFTACPNKPTDEPVTIPDGMYEETAHYVWTNTREISYLDPRDSTFVVVDTFLRTNVMVVGGDFVYPDLCKDTMTYPNGAFRYKDHFIYGADYYCKNNKVPARAKSDGYVYLDKPHLRYDLTAYIYDTMYSYRFRINHTEEAYTFEIIHNQYHPIEHQVHTISDTLRRM